ncbi:helix-turn-helix domain-containing protein [Mycobacteroides abscessus]|uniref:helix-turn-helix domain-containing protein n=1 Tax=Mycobacteroides abscessus TaxID=36809 RepID=UPI0005DF4790|nr:helix-turn-helix domain-containing protein [Mycobacteroides abscessus]CPS10208.1 Uncharacterised protein [Mycobacteroides abscessus]CPS26379.1 Uncharacterised protein [Mycobacteroides abscessus]CPS28902.1 Uncharacterised protein [Mycobacteroides abscessus]CPT09730.1 Uncharacterised protein [Mycobacteroides abscessus]CPT29337.1 Uncharacterised protein [Mycobacteroides abscessus]
MNSLRLDDDDIEWLLFCANEVLGRRRLAGVPIPHRLISLAGRLDLHAAMSADGHENNYHQTGSDREDLIDSTQAARILGVTPRHLRRLHADLDGRKIAGRWMFKTSTVDEYRTAKEGSDP